MDAALLLSDLTTNPDPVRFDGTPPAYEPQELIVANLGSLTGILPALITSQITVDRLYFYINDHLGTPRIVVDDAGEVVWIADHSPFGAVDVGSGSGAANNFRFAGQYYDAETGLHYNYHRYYDTKTGRYLTPDPIGLAGGINLYAYTENNPVNWTDRWGLDRAANMVDIYAAFHGKKALYNTPYTYPQRGSLRLPPKYFNKIFQGSQYGGGTGVRAKGRLGPIKVEAGMSDITGKRVTATDVEDFCEEKAGVSGQFGPFKISSETVNGEGSLKPEVEVGNFSWGDLVTVELGATIPHPGSGSAVNLELHIHLDEVLSFEYVPEP